jgi:hypothetical protein
MPEVKRRDLLAGAAGLAAAALWIRNYYLVHPPCWKMKMDRRVLRWAAFYGERAIMTLNQLGAQWKAESGSVAMFQKRVFTCLNGSRA